MDSFKRIVIVLSLIFFLAGCATYKFQQGKTPNDKGYVVSRDDYTILEYTLGKDNTVPDIALAKERFNRRKKIVEDYYKRMGYIENHFKMAFWDPCVMFLKVIGGIFRLPSIALSDYKSEHNPAYREKIMQLEAERELRAETRIKQLKDDLNVYLQQDLAKEKPQSQNK